MKANYTVVIGRFQLFHDGHQCLIDEAIKAGDKTIVVLGSANGARSIADPFTAPERQEMIETVYPDKDLLFIYMPDSAFDNEDWTNYLKEQVHNICSEDDAIKLVGHSKDHSSFYLRLFPEWDYLEVPSQKGGISATDVRQHFFESREYWKDFVPKSISNWLEKNWIGTPEDFYLLDWWNVVRGKYTIPWNKSPYKPIFVTADAVVFCNNHVLVIKRVAHPGKGQYALAGGFLDEESVRSCAVRELQEETNIDVTYTNLQSSITDREVFDFPNRDTRGRYLTHAFKFDIISDKLPKVEAGDDAGHVEWIPVEDLSKMDGLFYADHLRIIRYFLGIKLERR